MLEGHNGIVTTEEAMCSGRGLREEQGAGRVLVVGRKKVV